MKNNVKFWLTAAAAALMSSPIAAQEAPGKLIDQARNSITTIIELLTLVKEKHFEYDEAFQTVMEMIAEGENNANARYISTQQKLVLLEKIIRENNLDKDGILDTIIN